MAPLILPFILLTFATLLPPPTASLPSPVNPTAFQQCITNSGHPSRPTAFFIPTANKTAFDSLLNSTAQNLRFTLSSVTKPQLIFTPLTEPQVQAAVICARRLNLQLRFRSGGHDYEGLSYTSVVPQPFVLVDLSRLRNVTVDLKTNTAWAQAGATTGELYYWISKSSKTLAFPAGLYTSLGIGGHITGGAYGSLMRKYGLGADNALDVRIVDAEGRILNRSTMGEDHFWALCGGGGGSFGVILAWKLRLVTVPETVTVFTVIKTLEQNGINVLNKWQTVAPNTLEDLYSRVIMSAATSTVNGKKTVQAIYQGLFLGGKSSLLQLMGKEFPELGLTDKNCTEMSWILSAMCIAGHPRTDKPDVLLAGKPAFKNYFKAKSDYARKPISVPGLRGLMNILVEDTTSLMIWNPYGGQMSRISESAIPFPHRKGTLFNLQYVSNYADSAEFKNEAKHEAWIERLYEYMADHVSSSPREAYANYRDLDIGKNGSKGSNCSYAYNWGPKYFKTNFARLVEVKTKVDPGNFFQHEQSIPTNSTLTRCTQV